MHKEVKKLIEEEVNKIVQDIPKEQLVEYLNTLLENKKIINSLETSYKEFYNIDNQITPENWKYFTKSLGVLVGDEEFQRRCKEINCKLYAVKFFTKLRFQISESTEETIKFELKKYFAKLITEDPREFMDAFFSLPFEFTGLVVRYLANIAYKERKQSLTPKLATAQAYFHDLEKRKNRFILEINRISKGKSNVLSIAELQELLDVKAFYEYNAVNCGVLEFIVRTLTSPKSKKKLEEEFGKGRVERMRQQALVHPSYIQYLQEIREESSQPFFNKDGMQNKNRDITFDDFVTQYFFPSQVIPKVEDTENTEQQPTPQQAPAPQPDVNVEQPSQEELLNQPPATPDESPEGEENIPPVVG
jgi:hypothetical protein